MLTVMAGASYPQLLTITFGVEKCGEPASRAGADYKRANPRICSQARGGGRVLFKSNVPKELPILDAIGGWCTRLAPSDSFVIA